MECKRLFIGHSCNIPTSRLRLFLSFFSLFFLLRNPALASIRDSYTI